MKKETKNFIQNLTLEKVCEIFENPTEIGILNSSSFKEKDLEMTFYQKISTSVNAGYVGVVIWLFVAAINGAIAIHNSSQSLFVSNIIHSLYFEFFAIFVVVCIVHLFFSKDYIVRERKKYLLVPNLKEFKEGLVPMENFEGRKIANEVWFELSEALRMYNFGNNAQILKVISSDLFWGDLNKRVDGTHLSIKDTIAFNANFKLYIEGAFLMVPLLNNSNICKNFKKIVQESQVFMKEATLKPSEKEMFDVVKMSLSLQICNIWEDLTEIVASYNKGSLERFLPNHQEYGEFWAYLDTSEFEETRIKFFEIYGKKAPAPVTESAPVLALAE